ncbi:hypothetical protein [Serratia plymuthica]|uniref:hypothetical protein n=1 Tax=Serratia plymuthica TaxID=82996 RepID=UPI00055BA4BF|nr:hypothetical protein [Serratia plymuthica]
MKLSIKNNHKKYIFLAISLLSVLIISVMSFLMFSLHSVPACKAVVKVIRTYDGEEKESVILVNLVPSGFREMTFIVNGQAASAQRGYTLSRMIEADYKYQSGYYYFRVKDIKKMPADNIIEDVVSKTLPIVNSRNFFLKVEALGEKSFVFTGNRAPAFICTTTEN